MPRYRGMGSGGRPECTGAPEPDAEPANEVLGMVSGRVQAPRGSVGGVGMKPSPVQLRVLRLMVRGKTLYRVTRARGRTAYFFGNAGADIRPETVEGMIRRGWLINRLEPQITDAGRKAAA